MKKTVNVLIMEPKNLLMDITKKAIQAKPDENYNIVIVGTATTAKAGYFELYKHRPHILFLNPELEDEDGLSFIKHALERMPYLKIVVMATKLVDKDTYLDNGAHAVAHVPIQRAALWRTIDQLIEEIDSIGLLDVSEYVPDLEESPSVPEEDLFEIDFDEKPDYTPIFEDIRKSSITEGHSDNDSPVQENGVVEQDSIVEHIDEEEMIVLDDKTSSTDSKNNDLFIVDDEEPTLIDFQSEESSEESEEDDEIMVFDPFDVSSSTKDDADETLNDTDAQSSEEINEIENQQDLFIFEPLSINDEEDKVENEDKNTVTDDKFQMFKFDPVDYEDESKEESLPKNEVEQENIPTNNESTIDLFKFESDGVQSSQEKSSVKTPIIEVEQQEFEDKNSSNNARTNLPLYSDRNEYNKSALKESNSFDSGFYNRNGHFVPLYPPRENFVLSGNVNVTDMNVESSNYQQFNKTQESESEESIFSSVKKLFKRR